MPASQLQVKRVPFAILFVALVFNLCLGASNSRLQAQEQQLRLPSFFSNHMVVQRDVPIKIWGWGEAGKKVTVSFAGQRATTSANKDGEWRIELPAVPANATGQLIEVVQGEKKIGIGDVLVGDVWFASGQSNMFYTMAMCRKQKAISEANNPSIRMFLATPNPASKKKMNLPGDWKTCVPENVAGYSATAYFFAQKLNKETGVPIGIIRSCIGGKRCECYISPEAMKTIPEGAEMVKALETQVSEYDESRAMKVFQKKLAEWKEKSAEIQEFNQGKEKKDRKKIARKPRKPVAPNMNPGNPTILYNGMIHPFVGLPIKGAIWYQGEANCRNNLAPIYQKMFTLMINDWRNRWGQDIPFYYVQLANFKKVTNEPGVEDDWATVQDQQRRTMALEGTGMVTINDVGAANDIHPKDKESVGRRLARWALKNQYGKDVVVSGPLYRSHEIKGGKVHIAFDHVGGGLKSRDGGKLQRFEIAGADKKWMWADAMIEGDKVIVSHADVTEPLAVRYAWAPNPEGANLVNKEGLPTSIFTTEK